MLVTPEIQAEFDQAQRILFLTGAGVSTPSGIPDYRSKNGIYNGVTLSPEYLLSATAFRTEPEKQYQFMKDNMYFPDAKPNVIHDKMAEMAKAGRAKIVTQNVDDLHVKAGTPSDRLIRFHGSLYDIYAPVDGKPATVKEYLHSLYRPGDGAILRPRITFYEEQPFGVEPSIEWVSQADLIVVVGTSFRVYPFAGLIQYASPDARLLAVNLEQIPAPANIHQVIGDASEFFQELK
ncbi:NAD-dependent protein deacylase [Leuconostocaceae bacterium ESL0723]|nr:NAD-dependent protein deacylase [Leuconostocaceae bacterium ESL0723]